MKKLVVFIISLVVLMSSLCLNVFAEDNEYEPIPSINARIIIDSVAGSLPNSNVSIIANSSFAIKFHIETDQEYSSKRAFASVSGTGFSVNGVAANVEVDPSAGELSVYCDSSVTSGRRTVNLVVMFIADGVTTTITAPLNINVTNLQDSTTDNTVYENGATISIVSVPNSSVNAGDTFTVGFNTSLIAQTGFGYSAGTVTVSGSGFTLAGSLAEQDIRVGYNTISVLVDPSLESGRYPVTVTVKYVVNGEPYTASRTLNIDVYGDETEELDETGDNASFKMTSASIPESRGRANLSTTLKLSFENTTGYTAENVRIRLSGFGSDILLNTYTDTVDVGNVLGGQKINASFPIKFAETVINSQSTIVATVIYDTPNQKDMEKSFNVYLQASVTKAEETTPESATLTPKVIVSQYSVDVENVTSGEEFTLTFVLENTSTEKDLRNMTVNVTPLGTTSSGNTSGPVFSFIDGTSSFYTDILEKNGTLEYSIRLKCSASAGAGSYPISISFNFEYANGGGYSSGSGDMDINLPVVQPIKFDLMEWYPPEECTLDGTGISFQYFNKSRNPMSALAITVEGDFEMPTQYVGSLGASSYDYFSGMITPVEGAQVGDVLTAILVFTFEDAAGEEQRIPYEFEVTIVEGGGMSNEDDWGMGYGDDLVYEDWGMADPGFDFEGMPVDGDNFSDESTGISPWIIIVIVVAAAAVIIIVIVAVVKKVKAKKEAEDEDDE